MKREYTPTPSPIPPSAGISPSAGDNDVITPVTPPKKQRKTPAKPSPAKTFSTSSQGSTAGDSPTGWTADTREALIAKVITLGLKACKPDDLATEVSGSGLRRRLPSGRTLLSADFVLVWPFKDAAQQRNAAGEARESQGQTVEGRSCRSWSTEGVIVLFASDELISQT